MKGSIRNWKDYNKSLVQRGNMTLWFADDIWKRPGMTNRRGRPRNYSDKLLEAALVLKNLFHLPFRGLEGFLASISQLMQLSYQIPDYTTLCRRQTGLRLAQISGIKTEKPLNIVVDSTGLKIYGEGEWCVKKHGKQYQRTWRKVHLAVNGDTLEIMAFELTGPRVQDFDVLGKLLTSIRGQIDTVIGDGAYDTYPCYEEVSRRGGKALFPPKQGARLSCETRYHKKAASVKAIEQRDEAVLKVRELGKQAWKKAVGYHQRSLVETTMYRLKTLLGERLRNKKEENRQLELALRCQILNKMMQLGRPLRAVA